MAFKDNFSEDDWHNVVQAPLVASFAITAADPGGLIGTFQEAGATARAMAEAHKAADGSLAHEVVTEFQTSEARSMARDGIKELTKGNNPAEATSAAIAKLGDIARLVESTLPTEAPGYKIWLRDIAQRVAEAAKEGGFLGFGGVAVSDAERQTLAAVDAALDGGTADV